MTSAPAHPPVAYEATLPLSWRRVDDDTGAADFGRTNLLLLRLAMFMEEPPAEPGEGSGADLHRLEAKVDLLLQLELERQLAGAPLPEAVPVCLSAGELAWVAAAVPVAGEEVEVALHLAPGQLPPLRLRGRGVAATAAGEAREATVRLDMAPALAEALERFVFRQHRRAVARRRHGTGKQEQSGG